MKRLTGVLATLCLLAGSAFAIPVEDPTAWALLQQQLVQWASQIKEAVLTNSQLRAAELYRLQINGKYWEIWKRLPQYGHDTTINVPVELRTLGWPAVSEFEKLATTRPALRALEEFKQTVETRNVPRQGALAREAQPRIRRNLETIFGEVAVSPKGVVQESIYREAANIMDQVGKTSEAVEENKINLTNLAVAFESGTMVNGDRERKGKEIDVQAARGTLINADVNRLMVRALVQLMLTQGHQIGELERSRFRGTEMNLTGMSGVNYSLRKNTYPGVD